jgi:hypothetical protein
MIIQMLGIIVSMPKSINRYLSIMIESMADQTYDPFLADLILVYAQNRVTMS